MLPATNKNEDAIINATFPDLIHNLNNENYLREKVILTPKNGTVAEINDYIIDRLPEDNVTYFNSDFMYQASSNITVEVLYPIEFLNSLKSLGIPNHYISLKVVTPVMLLCNINQTEGLCNGTRLTKTHLVKWHVQVKVITGSHQRDTVFIPWIIMTPKNVQLAIQAKREAIVIVKLFRNDHWQKLRTIT